jgi:cytochrome P450
MDAHAGAGVAAMTNQMTDSTDLLAQILDYANRANPYPLYAELRKTPLLHAPNGSYVVSTYREIMALMHDPRIGTGGAGGGAARAVAPSAAAASSEWTRPSTTDCDAWPWATSSSPMRCDPTCCAPRPT